MIQGPKGPIGPRRNAPSPDQITERQTNDDFFPTPGRGIHPEYSALPECVKSSFTPKEFSWMDDEQRKSLIHDLTNPEVEE